MSLDWSIPLMYRLNCSITSDPLRALRSCPVIYRTQWVTPGPLPQLLTATTKVKLYRVPWERRTDWPWLMEGLVLPASFVQGEGERPLREGYHTHETNDPTLVSSIAGLCETVPYWSKPAIAQRETTLLISTSMCAFPK